MRFTNRPLALLRENTQNAFDAIRMREALGADFVPVIRVQVDAREHCCIG